MQAVNYSSGALLTSSGMSFLRLKQDGRLKIYEQEYFSYGGGGFMATPYGGSTGGGSPDKRLMRIVFCKNGECVRIGCKFSNNNMKNFLAIALN